MNINCMLYAGYKDITKEEYYDWFKDAHIIQDERCVFSLYCGTHEFSTIIHKKDMTYDLGWGYFIENKETKEWYGVRKMSMQSGQQGDGI